MRRDNQRDSLCYQNKVVQREVEGRFTRRNTLAGREGGRTDIWERCEQQRCGKDGRRSEVKTSSGTLCVCM